MLKSLPAFRFLAAGSAGISLLFLAGCGLQSANPATIPTPAAAIPTVAPNLPAQASNAAAAAPPVTSFTNQNWGIAFNNPASYKGTPVDITGQVFNIEEDATRMGVQMWTDPVRAQGNTVVVFTKQGFPSVQKDDQIEVQGTIDGVFTGKSDGGDTLTLPRVQASTVKVLQHASPAASASASARPSASSSAAASASASSSAPARPSTSAAAASSPTASPKALATGLYRVAGAGANGLSVRAGPGVSQTKIGVVHDGEVILVVGQAATGWAQMQGDGFTGFVSTDYLTGPATLASTQPLAKLSK